MLPSNSSRFLQFSLLDIFRCSKGTITIVSPNSGFFSFLVRPHTDFNVFFRSS
jgi:hypothetical protein